MSSDGEQPAAPVLLEGPPPPAPPRERTGAALASPSPDLEPAAPETVVPTLRDGPPPPAPPRERTGNAAEAFDQPDAEPPKLLDGPPPPAPPRERTGDTVEASDDEEQEPPKLLEGPPPPAPPRERTGSTADAPSSAAPVQAPPPPDARRVLGIPARPRLRISFGWGGDDKLRCEAALMDEQRQLVHRAGFNVDSVVERVFTWFASQLVKDARAAGAVMMVAPSADRSSDADEP